MQCPKNKLVVGFIYIRGEHIKEKIQVLTYKKKAFQEASISNKILTKKC